MEIIAAILTLSVLGLVFGIGLSLANKKLCVETDPRIGKIFACLPGANCGACGKPGCIGFAESLIQGQADIGACVSVSEEKRKEIALVLGVETSTKIKKIAVLHCHGGVRVKDKFLYHGLRDCIAANLVLGGQKACSYACLGFGNCVRICPFDAIKMGEDGLPVIDILKCKACGKCVATCPKKLFTLTPIDKPVYVACHSFDLGKVVMQVCPVGCIACKKCETVCPTSAIKVINNLAVIDYNKCISCGKCVEVCPRKIILKRHE
ncbi:MAG: RnfABCDGE type electron transport complex subunit B [Candidatus Omnitrophota bacterium]